MRPDGPDDEVFLEQLLERVPSTLYRFRPAPSGDAGRHLRRLLTENRMYFPSRQQFNDPLDCAFEPQFMASSLVVEQHWRKVARERGMSARERRKAVRRLTAQNVLPAGRARFAAQVTDVVDGCGIGCFTSAVTSPSLWAYYASDHRGGAVRFDTSLVMVGQLARAWRLLPVEVCYSNEPGTANYYTDSVSRFIIAALSTKAKEWKHEAEWRIVLANHIGEVVLPDRMITGVILGLRATRATEDFLRDCLKGREEVEILRAPRNAGSVGLHIGPA